MPKAFFYNHNFTLEKDITWFEYFPIYGLLIQGEMEKQHAVGLRTPHPN